MPADHVVDPEAGAAPERHGISIEQVKVIELRSNHFDPLTLHRNERPHVIAGKILKFGGHAHCPRIPVSGIDVASVTRYRPDIEIDEGIRRIRGNAKFSDYVVVASQPLQRDRRKVKVTGKAIAVALGGKLDIGMAIAARSRHIEMRRKIPREEGVGRKRVDVGAGSSGKGVALAEIGAKARALGVGMLIPKDAPGTEHIGKLVDDTDGLSDQI